MNVFEIKRLACKINRGGLQYVRNHIQRAEESGRARR